MLRRGKAPSRELLAKIFNGNHEMIKEFEKLYETDQNEQEQIDAIQKEIDRIEAGAGLGTDGAYIVPTGTSYIDTSTSLANADKLLDEAIFINTRTLIINKSAKYQASVGNQLILCDATSGAFNITLPDPTLSLVSGVSIEVGITKIDTSMNIVTILPFASEKIVGEDSQDLQLDGEVLNFSTDGISWNLRN